MRLYFVRHGESKYNVLKLHQHGEVPLSKTGEKQAKAVAKRFRKIPIDTIIASDYMRAKNTAEEISTVTGKEILFNPLIRERKRPSELTGTPYTTTKSKQIYQQMYRHRNDPNWHYSDEENFWDATERAKKFIKEVEKREEKRIAVVSHGAFIKFILAAMMFEDTVTPDIFNRFYLFAVADNTGITVCEKKSGAHPDSDKNDPRRWHLLTWNDHTHVR